MLSGLVVYQFCFPSVKGSSEYQNLGLLVSPDGKAFEIGVNQSKTFTVQALNGSEPFSYSWIIYPSGNFNLTVNEITYTVDAGSPILTYGSSLSLLFPHATKEYVSVQVKATDSNGVSGCLLQPFIVADPYTSPNYYFDASTCSVSYIIQTDGLGWYRAIKGEDGSLYISSGSDPNTVFSSVFSACGNVGSVYVCDGNYAGASLVVPDGVRLILEQGVISLTYAIEASATTTILDYANGVFLSYSSGTLTSSIDLANGSITLTGNVVANNFESVEPIISYSCMVYLDGSTYKAKMNNGTVVATSSNITAIQELALSYVSSGTVYLKGVLFDYDVTVPEDVLLVESVDGVERKFINSANSQGSPYTISVDTVQSGYYLSQDCMGRIINSWSSTNATYVLKSTSDIIQANNSGEMLIKNGNYTLDREWLVNGEAPLTITGEGRNTIIKRPDNMYFVANPNSDPNREGWANLLHVYKCKNVVIQNLAFEGNYQNQDMCNDGNHPQDTWAIPLNHCEDVYNNIFLDSTSNSTIQNCWVYDSGTNNIRVGSTLHSPEQTPANDNIIRNNYVFGGRNGILFFSSGEYENEEGGLVQGNICYNGKGYAGVYIVQFEYVETIGNYIYGYSNPSEVQSGGIRYVSNSKYSLISDNIVEDCQFHLIYLASTSDITVSSNILFGSRSHNGLFLESTNCFVTGNKISNNTLSGIVSKCADNRIVNNKIENNFRNGIYCYDTSHRTSIIQNDLVSNGYSGIMIEKVDDILIKGNNVINNEWDTSYITRAGIYINNLSPYSDRLIVENNYFYDTRTGDDRTQRYGFHLVGNAVSTFVFKNNVILNMKTSSALIVPNEYTTVKFNVGFVTENSGNNTGTGSEQTIAHGLNFTPSLSQVHLSERSTGGALAYQSKAPDANNIYVIATNGKDYNWDIHP